MKKTNFELRSEKTAELRKVLNLNFAVSYFVPVVVNGNIVDAAFLYTSAAEKEKTRPFGKVILDHKTGALLEYTNSYLNDFADSEKYPMTTKIDYSLPAEVTVADQAIAIKMINTYYDDICQVVFKDDISDEIKDKIRKYKELFYKSVPASLLPFYEALSCEYFQWLNNI